MDPVGAFIDRIVGAVNQPARGHLWWLRRKRAGDMSLRLTEALVGVGDVVLDIGANWGMFTYRLARLVGPTGRVHSFEPDPSQAERLRRFAAKSRHVSFHGVALSDQEGAAALRVPVESGEPVYAMGTLELAEDWSEVANLEVAVRRLDDVLGPDRGRVSFIKCDVEGHEYPALRGAQETLGSSRPTLLVEIEQRHQKHDIADTFGYLKDQGYDGYVVRPEGVAPIEEFDVRRDQTERLGDGPAVNFGTPPGGYLNEFLFVSAGAEVPKA